VLALFIAMVIYGLSYLTIPGQQGARLAQAEETQAVIVEPPKPAPAPAKPAPALSQHTPVEVAVKFTAGKNALPDHQVPVPAALAPVAPVETVAPFALAQAATSQPAEPAQPAARILLKAVEPTYIQIRDPKLPRSRSILIARVLNVGESYAAPDRAGLVMQTGNAGGLQVEVDGRSLGVMGRSGEVITRMPLDPSYFLEREATTQ
jgi:cytoskeleton protein RodZ